MTIALGGYAIAAPQGAAAFKSAIADPIRPPEDVARDADRKPAELLAFAGVRSGMSIAELAPGGGYFTRILTSAVGSKGHVYAITAKPSPGVQALAGQRSNLTVAGGSPGTIPAPGQVAAHFKAGALPAPAFDLLVSAFAGLIGSARQRRRNPAFRGRVLELRQALTASLIGFVVGAFFLSLAYHEMLYTLIALAAGVVKVSGAAVPAARQTIQC